MSHAHVCIGAADTMTCRFDGACYGEICISPAHCRLKEEELTDKERAEIAEIRRVCGLEQEGA
jgi:hypothetical protein